MNYTIIGQSDLRVSTLGLGCVTFGREIDRLAAVDVLDYAIDGGINLVDTAAAYGNGASESVIGDWIASRGARERIVLATKVHGSLQKSQILSSIEESLQRLRTDFIDLFQLHLWNANTPLDETLGALDVIVQQGKARFVGCSNWRTWQLAKGLIHSANSGAVRFQSIQPPYNLVQREIEQELLPLCVDQQIGVITYSPLAAGFLTGKYRRSQPIPSGARFDIMPGHQSIYFTDRGYAVLDQLERVAKATTRSMPEMALAWVLRQPHITSILFGARERVHVDQALQAQRLAKEDSIATVLTGLDRH